MISFIQPNWPAPSNVKAYCTTKFSGNLADHVGDESHIVAKNREKLIETLALPSAPRWLQQVHGTEVINAAAADLTICADASFSTKKEIVCCVLTADCLPILFCSEDGRFIAATHAGWKGLANGIIENTVKEATSAPQNLLAYLGPAIGNQKFEIKQDVYDIFIKQNIKNREAFKKINETQWLADIYALAKIRLRKLGIDKIYGGDYCTFSDEEHFYSFRRDGDKTGRMLSLIWQC